MALSLTCDKSGEKLFGSDISGWYCVASTRALRVSNGDVAISDTVNFTSHGLNGAMAAQALIRGQLTPKLKEWISRVGGTSVASGPWSLDLMVTRLTSRNDAAKLADTLATYPGVTAARLLVFNQELAKYELTGTDPAALKDLPRLLDESDRAPLTVNYEAARVIHAAYSRDEVIAARAALFVRAPDNSERWLAEATPTLASAALRNMGYLVITSESATTARNAAALAASDLKPLTGTADLVAFATGTKTDSGYMARIELMTLDKRPAGAGVATDRDFAQALALAARAADADVQRAAKTSTGIAWLTKPAAREAARVAAAPRLLIDKIDVAAIFPARIAHYNQHGLGTISYRNAGTMQLNDVEVRYTIGDTVIGTQKLAPLPPGAASSATITLQDLPPALGASPYTQLKAEFRFTSDKVIDTADAYAPIVIHARAAIDWRDPASFASFVTGSEVLRTLASEALSGASRGRAPTRELDDAAAIFERLFHAPLAYVRDPVATQFRDEIDTVQTPLQTAARLAGDCDDLTALLLALYESVGLSTAVVTVPGHVFGAVEAGALAGANLLFALPQEAFIEVDGLLMVPIEATAIGKSFDEAWAAAASAARKAPSGTLKAFRTRDAWRAFGRINEESNTNRLTLAPARDAAVKGPPGPATAPFTRELKAALTGTSPTISNKITAAAKATNPVAVAALQYLSGDTAAAIEASRKLCEGRVASACYNLAVMAALTDNAAASDPASGEAASAATRATLAETALSVLPPHIALALADAGGTGLASEASPEAEARRRIQSALQKARERLRERGTSVTNSPVIRIEAVGGRKGAPVLEPRKTAFMFFYRAF